MNQKIISYNTVALASHTYFLELHVVASQSPSLIAEDVLYLSQLLIEVRGVDIGSAFHDRTVYVFIELDQEGLHELDSLEANNQGNGNEVLDEQQPPSCLYYMLVSLYFKVNIIFLS